jgi:carbonic anhydrase
MIRTRPLGALASIVSSAMLLAGCGSPATVTTTAHADGGSSSSADIVALAVKVRELERRIEALEGGGEHAGDEHTNDEHTSDEPTTDDEHADDAHADDEHTGGEHAGDEHTKDEHDDEHAGAAEHAGDEQPTAWSYADAERWGELDPAFATCGTGMEQSPIDLLAAEMTSIPDPELAYEPAAATVTHTGHTVEVELMSAGTATIDDASYELVQVHFHAPSEHTIEGVRAPVEAHLVHRDAAGRFAVIGVMVVEGAADPHVDEILANVPAPHERVPLPTPIDARSLLPAGLMAYRYSGSLTTPPCTEGVAWSVLTQPVSWSREQIAALVAHIPEPNNRPLQPLDYRILRLDVVAG